MEVFMILEGFHEKDIFRETYPFRLEINESADFQYPLHWHNAVELVYSVEGSLRITVNGFEFLLSDSEILLIPSGEIHDIHSYGEGKRFFIQFDPSLLDGFGDINSLKSYLTKVVKISSHQHHELHKALEKLIFDIIKEYETKETGYALALNARIFDILVLLSRSTIAENSYESPSNTKKVFGLEKINSSFVYIENNYKDEITLKDISAAVGFSEYHFSRLFKEITEKNFHSFLNEFRIKKAEKLLTGSNMTIAQISHEVGFNSFATFNRLFKKIKGCPPTLYRKSGR
jgi:AraC-like DNA-binding protein